MKTIFLASSFPGAENRMRGIFNFRFVKQMGEIGEEVFVVFFRMWTPRRKLISSYLYDSIKVTQICLPLIPASNYYTLKVNNFLCSTFGWLLLKKELKNSNLIHSVYLTTNGIIAGRWARKLKIPHISQAIGSDVNSDLVKFINKGNCEWMKRISGIITNSKALEKSLKSFFNNCPPIQTIYRGIEIREVGDNFNFRNKGTFFLYLGGLEDNKSLEFGINTKGGVTLMEAWKSVENELFFKNAKLFFGGPDSESLLFKKWKKQLQHPEAVELIGKIDPDEVRKYAVKSDMVIIPSMEEGLPNFLMESAANKRAAIGSDAGGIPEVIIHGETGYIFQKGNAHQLANLLVKAASDDKKAIENMGQAAHKREKTYFNAENYSRNIMNFYKKIISNVRDSRNC